MSMSGLTIGSLFSGIGGLELGLERALAATTQWQVEIEPFCRRVLAKHWPEATRYEDVRCVGSHNLSKVDILCGGFPCQDISLAGNGAGLQGERSGLFYEYMRIIRELRPAVVVMENVAALRSRGLDEVLHCLAESRYDAQWDCVPAAAVGAPHRRDRIFVIATDAERFDLWLEQRRRLGVGWGRAPEPDVDGEPGPAPDADGQPQHVPEGAREDLRHPSWARGARGWTPASCVRGVDDGVPRGLDGRRLKALGNAVVPQVAERVGREVLRVLTGAGYLPRILSQDLK